MRMILKEDLIDLLKTISNVRQEALGFIILLEKTEVSSGMLLLIYNSIEKALKNTNNNFDRNQLIKIQIFMNNMHEKEKINIDREELELESLLNKI